MYILKNFFARFIATLEDPAFSTITIIANGFEFEDTTKGGSVPKEYIKSVKRGIEEAMGTGEVAGYPVVDIEAKIIDGKEHAVDSSELSFKVASSGALRLALDKAHPVLLEPVMNLEVFVDNNYLGDVLSDLSSRRGRESYSFHYLIYTYVFFWGLCWFRFTRL